MQIIHISTAKILQTYCCTVKKLNCNWGKHLVVKLQVTVHVEESCRGEFVLELDGKRSVHFDTYVHI